MTFRNRSAASELLREKYFSFGRAPFNAISLSCNTAPAPEDVIWQNMHVSLAYRIIIKLLLGAALFVFVVAVVTPVTISEEIRPILTAFEKLLYNYEHKGQ